jgi:hypothetical protein
VFSTPARISRPILVRLRISSIERNTDEPDEHADDAVFLDRRLADLERAAQAGRQRQRICCGPNSA